jgi:hypothetical protein
MSLQISSGGRKRRFLAYGAVNVLLTNLVLQALLVALHHIGLATFLSQLFNVSLGFVLYGKRVFRVERLQKRAAGKYALFAMVMWCLNWSGISALVVLGMQRNLAALFLIPLLAPISYTIQRLLVFRNSLHSQVRPAVLE